MAPGPHRSGAEHDIQFGVLGPLEVTIASRPIQVGTPKQRAVLAMLVANANRAVSAADLISAIWEDEPLTPSTAAGAEHFGQLELVTWEKRPDAIMSGREEQ